MSSLLVHEVLAALLSHPGELIQPTYPSPPPSLPTSYQTSRSLTFIDPSERQRIDSIVHLGCLHHHLLALTSPPPPLPSSHSPHPCSSLPSAPLYLSALRRSVSSTLLTSYHSTILHAEAAARSSPSYPLSSLQLTLHPFTLLFPPLTSLLTFLTSPPAPPRGGQLLSRLSDESRTGYPLLSGMYRAMLRDVQRVWYGQVEGWCVYGQVDDPHGEFFIARVARPERDEGKKVGKGEGEGEGEGEEGDRYAQVWDEWVVRGEMVPSYIPSRSVHSIHFIGRAINLLHLHSPSSRTLFLSPPFLSFLSGLSTLRDAPTFSSAALDAVLTPLHSHLTQRLSSVLLASSDLTAHLRALHSFVLLSDSTFAHFLLTHAAPLMSSPPTPHAARDLSALLQSTLASAVLQSHPQAPLLRLTLETSSFHFPPAPPSAPFHCLGDFAVTAQAIRGRRGAVWHGGKMLVEHGWEVGVTVVWEGDGDGKGGDGRMGWGFALQNDSLSLTAERGKGEGVDASLLSGLVNSVVVEVTRYTTGSGLRREQLAVFHFPHPPATFPHPPPARRLMAVTGSWSLFDGRPHTLTFTYTTATSPTLSVGIDGEQPPAMSGPLKLAGTMQLDAGRAWVGVVCGGVRAGVRVERWSMQQRLPSGQPLLAWRNLRLSLRVTGPLSLILRPSAFERYASLFRFLFDLARCSHALQMSWHQLGVLRKRQPPLTPPLPALLGLRHAMHFFTSTILRHLYHSIIHPSLAVLLTAIPTLSDFLHVRKAHDAHLTTMVQGCWVRDRVVMGALRDVMGVAERVVGAVEDSEVVSVEWVEEVRAEWERLAALLLTLWTRKSHVISNPSLSTLLLSLDYNGHFTRMAIRSGLHSLT